MKVDVKETSFVCPAQDTPRGSLWLSEFDLFFPNIHNNTVHFFKPSMDTNPSRDEMTRILKQSLAQVLVPFYPAAGRLGKDKNGRVQIECNAKGAMFVVAEADCTLDEMLDIGESGPISKFKPLIQPIDYSKDISSHPLVISKVTYFKCGGMCLAVAMHHWVADGSSAAHFFNSWADAARGRPIEKPIHDRRSITDRALPSPKFDHREFDPNAVFGHRKPQPTPVDCSTVYLKISLEHINTLKGKANIDADASASSQKYSVYESLAAHVWRCTCKARGLPDEQKTSFVFVVNARPRLRPPVPRELFGNVIYMTSAPAVFCREILKETLSSTAGRIQKAIMEKGDEYIRSGIAYLRDKQVRDGISVGSAYKNPNLGVVSWTRMPMHTIDFGWGSPVYFAPPSVRSEGLGYVLSGPSKEDGLVLYICLETQHIELFKKLFYDV